MIRNNANLIKWTSYALAFLLVFFFECCVLNRFPLHGAIPNLSILVVVAVALFEGSINGAIFGLAIGFFCSAVYYRSGLMMIPIYTVIGACTGATRKEKIGRSLLGCAVCSLGGLIFLELCQILRFFLKGTSLSVLASLALPEALYSLPFFLPIYFLIHAVYKKVRTDYEL